MMRSEPTLGRMFEMHRKLAADPIRKQFYDWAVQDMMVMGGKIHWKDFFFTAERILADPYYDGPGILT